MKRFPRLYGILFLLPFLGYWLSYGIGKAVPDPLGNRPLAKLPAWEGGFPSSNWLQQSALWVIEKSPFRYRTIQMRNKALITLAHALYPVPVSPGHAEVNYGKDGWLFLLNETPAVRSKERLREIAKESVKLGRTVRQSGRRFYFAIFPDKMSVYPEYSGWTKRWAERYANRDLFPKIMEEIWEKNPEVRDSYLPIWKPLLETKKKSPELLYWEMDTHWNFAGALAATRALINGIQPGLFDESAVSAEGLGRGWAVDGGHDLSAEFLLQPDSRQARNYSIHRQKGPSKMEFHPFADPAYHGLFSQHCTSTMEPVIKGRTLIVGDSFAKAALPLMTPWFEDFTFFEHSAFGTPELAQALKESDAVIWTTVERGLTERVEMWTGPGRFYLRGALPPKGTTAPKTSP